MRRVGVLLLWPANDPMARASMTAFAQALARLGWTEGQNIRIDYRFAAGDPALFKSYAAELVRLMPDVLLAGASLAIAALRQQTRTIPIVFVNVSDPIGQGFVDSLARPGGNITGFTAYDAPLMGKWVQLLKEIAPGVTRVVVIFNPDTTPYAASLNEAIQAAVPHFGVTTTFAQVHDDAGIEEAVTILAREPGSGVIALPDIFNVAHRNLIVAVSARHGLPLIGTPDFPRAGGLMSYSFDTVEVHAQGHPTSIASSKAPARQTSQFSNQSNIRWLSTSRPLRRLASPSPKGSSRRAPSRRGTAERRPASSSK